MFPWGEKNKNLVVNAFWDDKAHVWVATSNDIPGLVTEAATPTDLTEKLKFIVPELLDANSLHKLKALSELPIMLVYQQKLRLRST
jgi:hypothetical protein